MKSMQSTSYRKLLIFLWLVLSAAYAWAEGGIYENLMIGIDPATGIITGAYHEERNPPGGPSFSCIFALKGNVHDSSIKAGFPGEKDVTYGRLIFKNTAKNTVLIKLDDGQSGCAQTTPADFKNGELLALSYTKPWRAVMIVTAKKAYFHDSASQVSRRRSYVVYSDSVGVLEVQGNWAKVEYVNENTSTTGWMQLRDLETL
jgi:hypothetical protein